jgi:hypothetical protein
MYSGGAGGDESASRDVGEEVSVAHESLGSKSDAFTVLVHVTKSEAAVSRDGECTTHEGQRKGRESVLEYELRRVTGIDNGAEDVEGESEGLLGTEVEGNNNAQVVEIADGSEMGGPDRMSHVPPVFSVGTQDDGELGAERAAHWDA